MNKVIFHSDGSAVLTLSRKDGSTFLCVIDAADYALVRLHHWCAQKKKNTFYVVTNVRKSDGKRTILAMHTLLLPDALEVDHKDLDGLNNQRANLRPATHSQNNANKRKQKNGITSPYKGVGWCKATGKYRARTKVNGKEHCLGHFTNQEDAAIAYNIAASHHFGAFAKLNDIQPAQQLSKAA